MMDRFSGSAARRGSHSTLVKKTSSRRSESQQNDNDDKSSFRNALVHVPVPSALLEGVHVLRVHANGKTQNSFMTLSQDKFTLYITLQKVNGTFLLARQKSTKRNSDFMERAIDIGAIDRIQRGQDTHLFELAKKHHLERNTSISSARSSVSANSHSVDGDTANDSSSLLFDPARSFSILFRGERTLDLMMTQSNAHDDRDTILDALDHVLRAYETAKVKVANDVLLMRYIWLDAVVDNKYNKINANELGKVLERINFFMRPRQLHKTYEKFAKVIGLDRSQRRRGLTFEQCCTFLHKIKRDTWMVKPVNVIWDELFGAIMNNGKPRTTVSDKTFLEKFLHEKQGQVNVTLEQVQKLFQRLHQLEIAPVAGDIDNVTVPNRLDKNRFEAYLLGRENAAFDPLKERFDKQLMTKPISEYWINTSHNTYLTGDQFTSHSSVEMYLNALYRGCRSLELDIWDGEWENGAPVPIVWHGHTMTTKIKFVDIIKVIKNYLNFNPSVFPIILSFENHCSIPFQKVMAGQLVDILGTRLYIPTESSLFGRLPSPMDLRGLVVIKGRRPDGAVADAYDTDEDTDDEGKPEDKKPVDKIRLIEKHGIAPELARLTLFHGTKYKNWDASLMNPTHHMHSFSESKVRSVGRQSKSRLWSIYNQSHMTRTFPAGSRVDSSNYNPLLAWSKGCQLVALNFQTPDAHLRLNDGRFRENGGCGYVLKPSTLMVTDNYSAFIPILLTVRVLSGSCLPKPKGQRTGECIDPYVKVSMYDIRNEEKDTCITFTTNAVPSNGFFPIWNAERFLFRVENGAVAMLQLSVYDKDRLGSKDDFIASASIPVTCLREGYRSVQLFDANNTRSGAFDFASLLIEIEKQQVVAEI